MAFAPRRRSLIPRRRTKNYCIVATVLVYLCVVTIYASRKLASDRLDISELINRYGGQLPDFSLGSYTSTLREKISKDQDILRHEFQRYDDNDHSDDEEGDEDDNDGAETEQSQMPDQVPAVTSKEDILGNRLFPQEDEYDETARYAFATLLAENVDQTSEGLNLTNYDLNTDEYFLAARVLNYQLLHSPRTRSATNIPFIILVTADVTQEKRDILIGEGAQIVEIGKTSLPDWMDPIMSRWRDQLAKLHVFEMTEYDKICYLDLDTLLIEPIDGIFSDPATEWSEVGNNTDEIKEDEAALPERYMLAAHADPWGPSEQWPPEKGDYFNAGFFVLGPSTEAYNYYLSTMNLSDRFGGGMVEQDMMNYAHRWAGNMPWKSIADTWNALWPGRHHKEHGVVTFHNKFWQGSWTVREAKKAAMITAAEQRRAMGLVEDWMDWNTTEDGPDDVHDVPTFEEETEEDIFAGIELDPNDIRYVGTHAAHQESRSSRPVKRDDGSWDGGDMEGVKIGADPEEEEAEEEQEEENNEDGNETSEGDENDGNGTDHNGGGEEDQGDDQDDNNTAGGGATNEVRNDNSEGQSDNQGRDDNTVDQEDDIGRDDNSEGQEDTEAHNETGEEGGNNEGDNENGKSGENNEGENTNGEGEEISGSGDEGQDGTGDSDDENHNGEGEEGHQEGEGEQENKPPSPPIRGPYWKLFRDLEAVEDEGSDVDPALREFWLQQRWEMEGFYHGLEVAISRISGENEA